MKYISIALFVMVLGCKEKYDIVASPSLTSILVVDGNLNSGQGPTIIKLSRTVPNTDTTKFRPETGAILIIEGKDNSTTTLTDMGEGVYGIAQANIITGQEYRLRIQTSNGKLYLSDYVLAKNNPPIDSIGWTRANDGVTVYVNTHDPQNSTWYYRWDFNETYEIRSHYFSLYKWDSVANKVLQRSQSEYVDTCYKSFQPTVILLGSSAKLQADVISEQPLVFIPNGSEKLAIKYSILVKQYSLTKEAYDYLQVMKKNTESIGSFFGVLPSELHGNIHSLSGSDEEVIGFITASPELEKRIFITNDQLSNWNYSDGCVTKIIANNPDSFKTFFPEYLPYEVYQPGPAVLGYYSSFSYCVDCTTRGGSLQKPSFW
ncbi:MAG: DUF4249 domain-containing protein [Flavisolibacter sp.]